MNFDFILKVLLAAAARIGHAELMADDDVLLQDLKDAWTQIAGYKAIVEDRQKTNHLPVPDQRQAATRMLGRRAMEALYGQGYLVVRRSDLEELPTKETPHG